MGLSQQVILEMENRGWSTIATFAFSSGYVPGSKEETLFIDQVLTPLLGGANHASAPLLRRLFFECFTLLSAELKTRIEKGPEEGTRKLADPERRVRFKQLEGHVQGIVITEHWEPAHCLTDLFVDQMEKNTLAYVSWDKCISRVTEMAGGKKDTTWKPSADKTLKEVETVSYLKADYSSDFKLFQLLARRGMAIHMSGMMSYSVHDKWAQILMSELHRDQPSSHCKITVDQLERADVELWNRIAEATRDGINRTPTGTLPVEEVFLKTCESPAVRLLLLPLSKPQHSDAATASAAKIGKQQQQTGNQQGKGGEKGKNLQQNQGQSGSAKGVKQTKSQKKKGKQVKRLEKYGASRTPEGEEICFSFNGSGCDAGDKCRRAHVCQKCFGEHPASTCKKS